ncbi:hypothetical protein CP982_14555 [Streptomyces spectabilis]|uniref:Uncharacterized protein n=1 Tax=Streptomyces spectabilis TaxID=68270 RepID=A0A5P2X948_STRST|nr:hypothetical protein CP982_14555 [Streptomyces spectabilis]
MYNCVLKRTPQTHDEAPARIPGRGFVVLRGDSMPRIQILELPAERHGDDVTTPFVLVVDQWTSPLHGHLTKLAEKSGARAVMVFEETMDVA